MDYLSAIASVGGPFAGMLAVWQIVAKPMLKEQKEERATWVAAIEKLAATVQENTRETKALTEQLKDYKCGYLLDTSQLLRLRTGKNK